MSTRSTVLIERSTVYSVSRKTAKTQGDHAARRISKATLSFAAFTFCGHFTQAISLLSPSTRSRILIRPHHRCTQRQQFATRYLTRRKVTMDTPHVCIDWRMHLWWRRGELHPCPTQHSVCINN